MVVLSPPAAASFRARALFRARRKPPRKKNKKRSPFATRGPSRSEVARDARFKGLLPLGRSERRGDRLILLEMRQKRTGNTLFSRSHATNHTRVGRPATPDAAVARQVGCYFMGTKKETGNRLKTMSSSSMRTPGRPSGSWADPGTPDGQRNRRTTQNWSWRRLPSTAQCLRLTATTQKTPIQITKNDHKGRIFTLFFFFFFVYLVFSFGQATGGSSLGHVLRACFGGAPHLRAVKNGRDRAPT